MEHHHFHWKTSQEMDMFIMFNSIQCDKEYRLYQKGNQPQKSSKPSPKSYVFVSLIHSLSFSGQWPRSFWSCCRWGFGTSTAGCPVVPGRTLARRGGWVGDIQMVMGMCSLESNVPGVQQVWEIPSGKRLHNTLKNHIFWPGKYWLINYRLPFSIAILT